MEAENRALRESRTLTEESLREYVELFEMAPIAYVVLDNNGCLLKMNHSACALAQTRSSEMFGLRFSGFLAESSSRPFLDHLTECRRFRNVAKSVALVLKAGENCVGIMMTGSCSDMYRGVFVPAL